MAGPLLDSLRFRTASRRPVWLMRQAGRYLPEYRKVRAQAGSFLDLCYSPEKAAEVTLQPLRRFDLDAAILFSDILVVPHAMGLDLAFVENEGPKLTTARNISDVSALKTEGPFWQFDRVAETVAEVANLLPADKALIGFCGAPWTVASYVIEGGSSERRMARAFAEAMPGWFHDLLEKIIDVSIQYLLLQLRAGAQVIQIFDSWAGDLPADLRSGLVYQPIRRIVDGIREQYPDVPVIVFARGLGMDHIEAAKTIRCAGLSVEQGVDIAALFAQLPNDVVIQGNLDPVILAERPELLESETARILAGLPSGRHIFNLGHGILPHTPVEHVEKLIGHIRSFQ